MIEEEAHRNALFCLKHAAEMPKVVLDELELTLDGNVLTIAGEKRPAAGPRGCIGP